MTRLLILVNGLPGAGKTTLAHQLGNELDAVVISKDTIKETVADAVGLDGVTGRRLGAAAMEMAWALAPAMPGAVIVESWWFAPRDTDHLRAGLERVGADKVVEVWCDASVELARARYSERQRHALHGDRERLASAWDVWAEQARPVGLCPTVLVNTSGPVELDDVIAGIDRAEGSVQSRSACVETTGADYLSIAEGYAAAFPDGDDPLRILARMTEELGEVASAVAHLERHGAKVAKHGEPDVQQFADEVEDLVHNAFALLRAYGAEQAFDRAVAGTLRRLRDSGHVT
ncbi:AAA family ATPase [Occultella kanbiaonis]|uniref:AAA family ATPase n=1 Tax=Occultella kanbiaonis TaxID=2675754 RepID=UPI0012B8DC26|nr:AAA family ATPase [Occultella kanbiaonis]